MILQRSSFSLKFILVLYSIFVFCFIAFIKYPYRYGDGFEYIYMAESFIQHKTPDQLVSDAMSAQAKIKTQNPYIYGIPQNTRIGYFKSHDNRYYSYHFWLYPLFVVPAQLVLHFLSANELKAFGITNTILYLLMLWLIYLKSPKEKRLLLVLLMAMSPLVPYITWTHPEVFSASLLTIAIVFYLKNILSAAILFSALSSSQNPPVAFFTIWCGIVYLYKTIMKYKKEKYFNLRDFIITALCSLPLMLAPLFFWVNFSTFNLIHKIGTAQLKLISCHKLFSFFFDLNQGAVIYSGLLLFVFIWCAVKNIICKNFKYIEFVFCAILMALLSLAAPNWNCGCSVVIRYFVWVYPLLVFYVVYSLNFVVRKTLKYLLIANAIILVILNGGFSAGENYTNHNQLATYVLSNFPYLYNPEHEIFAERTMQQEAPAKYPVVYSDQTGHVRKILTDKDGWIELNNMSTYRVADQGFHQKILQEMQERQDPVQYIDILNDEILLEPVHK